MTTGPHTRPKRIPYITEEEDLNSVVDNNMDCQPNEDSNPLNGKRTRSPTSDRYEYPKKTSKITISPSPSPVPTQNRYQKLPLVQDNTPLQTSNQQTTHTTKPPPIHAYGINCPAIVSQLNSIIKSGINFKYLTDHLLIRVSTPRDHNTTISFLREKSIPYYTYTAKASRPVKLVAKHLLADLDKETIKSDLNSQGAVVSDVSNLKLKNGTPSSCYLLSTPHSSLDNLKSITHILNMHVTLEPYRRRSSLPQCYRCQKFGHSSECCFLPPNA